MSAAKTEILQRIRESLPDVPKGETPEQVAVERGYRRTDGRPAEELIASFVERVAEYKAHVRRVRSGELRQAIGAALAAQGARRLVVPADWPDEWGPDEFELVRDRSLSNEQLDHCDGVLTGSALGIAQTGTIVLDGGRFQGRRAITLVPDYHLCVIHEDQIVGLVPEAVERLHAVAADPNRPMTWISGPSATSDIELNRVEGVHGPRTLEVLVVASD